MGAGSETAAKQKTIEDAWRRLDNEGRQVLINLESNELIKDKPEWLDEEKWRRAKVAIEKFRVGVSYSSFTGLLLILQLPEGLEPLLSTGNSRDIPALYQRYLATVIHVNSWYEYDVFNPETKGFKSIRQVRSMHKRVQTLMNSKFQVRDGMGHERMWMSQYDMAMTQFAFIGLCMLWPEKSAMIAASKEELELINYYWRVLGWLMGIQDEYNMCQFDNYDEIKQFNELVFEHGFRAVLKEKPCPKGLSMTQSICLALHYYMPLITFNNLAHWWSDCFHFNGYEPQPMTTKEQILHHWTKLSFNHLFKWNPFISFSTKLHKRKFEQRLKNREKVYEKLKAQYKDHPEHIFLSDRVDYFGKSPTLNLVANDTANIGKDVALDSQVVAKKHLEENNNMDEPVSSNKAVCPFGYGSTTHTPIQVAV